jgi:hypothetical protein
VVNVFGAQTGSDGVTYTNITLDRNLDFSNFSSSFDIPRYVVLKHIPDETNLILDFNATYDIPTDGLVYPQYLREVVKENSGNVIKSLKQQNLI